MKLRKILTTSIISATAITGFGALPSEPDFAFPKTVSKNALTQLGTALKHNDGPATVRALMNYGLAEGDINPDSMKEVYARFEKTRKEVKDSATIAMIDLVMANAKDSDSLTIATIANFGDVLKNTPSAEWKTVINADPQFFPTLYDFAVSQTTDKNVRRAAMAYDSNRPYPLVYLKSSDIYNFDQAMKAYREFEGQDVSVYLLALLGQYADNMEQRAEVYELCRKNTSPIESKLVKDTEAYVCRSNVSISGPAVISPDSIYRLHINATCINELTLTVNMLKPQTSVIKRLTVSLPGNGVFENDTVVELRLPKYGEYTITPSFENMSNRQWNAKIEVKVTDFMIAQQVFGKKVKRLALAGSDGRELTDVTFSVVKDRLQGVRGNDRYSPTLYNETGYERGNDWNYSGNLLTDRAIYHPGDSLHFAGTAMRYRSGSRELVKNKEIEVVLRNANHQAIDTARCTTDDFGRIHGSFLLPKEGLTGRFMLNMAGYTSLSVMVTDYKAPTFDVELNATRLSPTEVELTGYATGYNGFPIADAQVAVSVNELPAWVWFRDYRNVSDGIVATDTVQTAADGTFRTTLTIPANVNLAATSIVSSPTGESHEASCFLPRKRYFITAEVNEFLKAGKRPNISVINAEGEPADVEYEVTLIPAADKSARITPNAEWDNIPSGKYSLEIVAEDADTVTRAPLYIYRDNDRTPPLETALFVPERSILSGSKLLLGTSYSHSHILYTVWTPDSILEQRWLTPEAGMFTVDINLPEGIDNATISLLTLHDYAFSEERVAVKRPDVARSLKMNIESLRDKVTPGNREKWTVRVTDNLGNPVPAAVMLDVYSKALDALQPMHWGFNAPSASFGKDLDFNRYWRTSANAWIARNVDSPRVFGNVNSGFITYGQYWPREHEVVYSLMEYKSAAPMRIRGTMAMADSAVLEEAVVEDEAEAVEENAAPTFAGSGADNGASATAPAEDYRMPEMPVALWQPVLTTDADGTMHVEFIAPNANTTWAVKALAYDSALLSGTFGADIISSKPVMVQPQLPRFLRIGDRIELRASVQNNTDTLASISSFIELYNPATEEIISRREFADTIGPRSAALIATELCAPAYSMIGVRVKASDGTFTDGEQTIVPILPGDVAVQTGKPLFMPADSTTMTIAVPKGGVLTFTANAVWECVASLPGLQTSESKSAFASVSTLFSAATARGLLRQYPEIGKALHQWESEDSVLISRLKRNEDLKIALLGSTPWVGAAQSETEQRARLLLLFNRKLTDQTINDAVKNLARLVRKGGIAWTANSEEPSTWVTTRVLTSLAQLKRMGYLPQNNALDKIIREAVKYLDNEVAREFAKNPKATFPAYVMLRAQFPELRQSAPARRAAAATVQQLVGHWRNLSLPETAAAAIILNENNYPTTARKLIESLRQHEVWNYREMCPLYLEAFNLIEPACREVDEIRSAYIARKHSMDWGEGPAASDLIAAILQSGAKWLVAAANELTVKVDGTAINPEAEAIMGEFRLNLPDGANVEIAKGNFPAWGGVFSNSQDSIASVEAFGSDELKITRSISGEMKVGAKVTVTLTLEASQPMDYVVVKQPRCAAFEPVNQLPTTLWLGYLTAYREPCPTETNWFFNRLAKGTTTITEEFYITAEGTFALAPAEAQSQYSPEYQAHTSGSEISISE